MRTSVSLQLILYTLTLGTAITANAQVTDAEVEAWRQEGALRGWTFKISRTGASYYAPQELCGMVRPPGWEPPPPATGGDESRVLPSAFDWRWWVRDNPIEDQGGCGSCWAFGTCSALAGNILIRDGDYRDLSEQWLLSCNSNGWDCTGGWFAHDYHEWKGDPCDDSGAVYEVDFPYVATEAPCACPYTHRYWIDDWEEQYLPSIAEIKQAMLDHGPLAVSMYAGSTAFSLYSGGIYNACSPGSEVDHCVVLLGWDDNQGSDGVWFMRNSWGTDWGEDANGLSWDQNGDGIQDNDGGYMRIEYDCARIAEDISYVEYPYTGRGVWLDFDYTGFWKRGTFEEPYDNFDTAISNVDSGGVIWIKASSSSWSGLITEAMTLRAGGGAALIGH